MLFNFVFVLLLPLSFLDRSFAIIEIQFDVKNECSVRLETDHGIETCLNQKCSDFKDPWRVVNSHIQDQPCYLHYLKLSFTTYDQLLVFIELQEASDNSLDTFFANDLTKHCMLEIEITKIYPFNENYFLTEDMLNKLGGRRGKITILQLEILNWYKSTRSLVQMIENDIVDRQPFQQITIYYPCNVHHTLERLVLAKYLDYQERSSCPTQINVIKGDHLLASSDETIDIPEHKRVHSLPYTTWDKLKIVDQSFNKSNQTMHHTANEWNIGAKIVVIAFAIVMIVAFIVYYYCCSTRQSTNGSP